MPYLRAIPDANHLLKLTDFESPEWGGSIWPALRACRTGQFEHLFFAKTVSEPIFDPIFKHGSVRDDHLLLRLAVVMAARFRRQEKEKRPPPCRVA
jgi:hypothetical protein